MWHLEDNAAVMTGTECELFVLRGLPEQQDGHLLQLRRLMRRPTRPREGDNTCDSDIVFYVLPFLVRRLDWSLKATQYSAAFILFSWGQRAGVDGRY